MMERINLAERSPDFKRRNPLREADEATRQRIRRMLRKIRTEGWEAVVNYSGEYDDVRPSTEPVVRSTLEDCWNSLTEEQRHSLETAARRIRRYQTALKDQSRVISDIEGGALGEIVRPIERVGCYVPGGRVPLPSTVLMTALVAEIAGVPEIIICSPPGEERLPHDSIIAASSLVESIDVYGLGGVQAIGAMTYGTGPIPAVDLIAGPGNLFVTLAKKEVFGEVGIDLLAGPSEIAIVAEPDATRPEWIATDLVSQAEHDPQSRCYLFSTHELLFDRVEEELERLLDRHPEPSGLRPALSESAFILGSSIDELIPYVNELAPEHLELHLEEAETWARRFEQAGALFVGPQSPEPLGDYVAGPNHTLPTGGTARFFNPLSVRTFQRRQSMIMASEQTRSRLADDAATLARMESLPGHEWSVTSRDES